MKAIIFCYEDVDAGVGANDLVLRAKVCFCGNDVPGGPIIDLGPDGNGLAINIAINALAGYPNAAEDALLARAVALGLPTLNRTDCLFPAYTRGS